MAQSQTIELVLCHLEIQRKMNKFTCHAMCSPVSSNQYFLAVKSVCGGERLWGNLPSKYRWSTICYAKKKQRWWFMKQWVCSQLRLLAVDVLMLSFPCLFYFTVHGNFEIILQNFKISVKKVRVTRSRPQKNPLKVKKNTILVVIFLLQLRQLFDDGNNTKSYL